MGTGGDQIGLDARLIPPTYVKPYVKRQKNDAADAEAICDAVGRPNMHFVPASDKAAFQIKSVVLQVMAKQPQTSLGKVSNAAGQAIGPPRRNYGTVGLVTQ